VVAEYAKVDNATFKILKRNLPGPFTFVLNASSKVPDKALARRKTLGVRIPANPVAMAIIRALGCPMITSSVKNEEHEYTTDPELINELYGESVDLIVDGGYGSTVATALIDLTEDEPQVLREGGRELIY
jgi:tRNA threonylcarbamoyl adenosine modification protein (Sua5/YciO/YrdC/YwlC family)